MTLKEFEAKYYLHDSFIERLNYDTSNATLTLVINFAFWMQKDYVEILADINGARERRMEGFSLFLVAVLLLI